MPAALRRMRFPVPAQFLSRVWTRGGPGGVALDLLLMCAFRPALLLLVARVMLPLEKQALLEGLYWWCGPLASCRLRGRLPAPRLGLAVHYSGVPQRAPLPDAGTAVRLERSVGLQRPAPHRRAWLLPGASLFYDGGCDALPQGAFRAAADAVFQGAAP